MSIVSISEAARLTNKHRRTIQRHIQSGQLSSTQQSDGQPGVQISELIRVYGSIIKPDATKADEEIYQGDVKVIDERDIEISRLKAELAGKEELIREKDRHIETQQKSISMLTQQNTALLTYTKPDEPKPKKSFFKRLLGF